MSSFIVLSTSAPQSPKVNVQESPPLLSPVFYMVILPNRTQSGSSRPVLVVLSRKRPLFSFLSKSAYKSVPS